MNVPVRDQVSAGGVVVRRDSDGAWQIALIATRKGQVWGLPKGGIVSGETLEQAAQREVREETGLISQYLAPLDTIQYWYYSRSDRTRYHKRVHFYLFQAIGGDVSLHDHEVDEARWFPLAEAPRLLTYSGERAVVAQAQQWLERSMTEDR